jgi:hypothetical protein
MKRFARLFILSALLNIALCLAADAVRTFTGIVHSNQCVGPACATQCPITKDPIYTLQTGDRAWVLGDAKTAARYAGKKVTITGTTRDNTITITSVTPAENGN